MTVDPENLHGRRPVQLRFVDASRPVSQEQAVELLCAIGFDRDGARILVAEYTLGTSERIGLAPDRWSLDVSDVASIATSHEWIDRYRDETLQQARRRALHYATSWARRAEQLDSGLAPAAAARAERAALLWAVRAGLAEPDGSRGCR
ncbi:hypothetical protein [Pseudonocardia sp. WMMC193]|uniref:hypothetical protein n=1 Tax=Pseudonocardia sp. WMMC193 TaxID=2911965 RepID=UPI001F301F6B|nr:hypothetical protein [Pseudonocardia sp. WMMC193]MCF7552607.1 hypothetical protein [Pseudonocardia sp. WMMC193]